MVDVQHLPTSWVEKFPHLQSLDGRPGWDRRRRFHGIAIAFSGSTMKSIVIADCGAQNQLA
jgi:hypothetical protein